MKICKKCGEEIDGNSKYCTKCGECLDENYEMLDGNEEYIDDEEYVDENENKKKHNYKIIIILGIILSISIISAVIFLKIKSISEIKVPIIELVNLDTANYPNIKVEIKANNYIDILNVKNLTIKEDETFQKNIDIKENENETYIISYESADKTSIGERNIKIAYLENGNESSIDTKYDAPKTKKEETSKSSANNLVNTYDKNEIDVKQCIDNYQKNFIEMINSKDTYYIKESIDLNGGLLKEFENTVKSYSEQEITENLKSFEVEKINKLTETKYEVIVFEKYYIRYGKKHESKDKDFRTKYIINKTKSGFKVNSLENIDIF